MWLSSQCLQKIGIPQEAVSRLELLARITPDDYRVFRDLGFLYFNELRDQEAARAMFARSLELNPDQPNIAALAAPQPAAEESPFGEAPPMPTFPTGQPTLPQPPQVPAPSLPQIPQMPQLPMPALPQ